MEILFFVHRIVQSECYWSVVWLLHAGTQTQAEGGSATFNPWLPRSLWSCHPNQLRKEINTEERTQRDFVARAEAMHTSSAGVHGLKQDSVAPPTRRGHWEM